MVGGAILAGASDLSYSLPGYIWVTICAVSTAAYLLLIRKLSDRTGEHPKTTASAIKELSFRMHYIKYVNNYACCAKF